jgi:alpha/beta hydrolase
MLIQTGGYDLLLTEDELLAEKAAADGTPVSLTIYPEMPHVFTLVLPELAESTASLEEMRDFVNRHMQQ